jgi:hypothetical protein
MPAAHLPANEPARLAALHSYEILDTASDAAFEELVALAAELTGAPRNVLYDAALKLKNQ